MTAERQDKGSDWAHAFRLPDGSRVGTVKAKGNKNALKLSVLQAVVRPGMRVVDIGSAEGLFAFYAAEAGASEVLGLDIMSERITRANDVSARLGMADRVVFRHADVAKDGDPSERGGRRDVALLFAVIHRVPDPITLLATLGSETDTLIVEWPAPYRFGARRLAYASIPVSGTLDRRNLAQLGDAFPSSSRRPYSHLSVGAVKGILAEFGHSLVLLRYAENPVVRVGSWARSATATTFTRVASMQQPVVFGAQQRIIAVFSRSLQRVALAPPILAEWDATKR